MKETKDSILKTTIEQQFAPIPIKFGVPRNGSLAALKPTISSLNDSTLLFNSERTFCVIVPRTDVYNYGRVRSSPIRRALPLA
jgi:hypothetical protein